MTRDAIYTDLLDILTAINEDVDWKSFGMEDSLNGTLDSMDFMDVMMELRKRYGLEVPTEDRVQFSTMKGCLDYLEPRLVNA